VDDTAVLLGWCFALHSNTVVYQHAWCHSHMRWPGQFGGRWCSVPTGVLRWMVHTEADLRTVVAGWQGECQCMCIFVGLCTGSKHCGL
jgi:hypothetical protein